MRRRTILPLMGAALLAPLVPARARPMSEVMDVRDAPLEIVGPWRGSIPTDAGAVIGRMRLACLDGVALLSDRQPEHVRVEDHSEGPPFIWLHSDFPTTAWMVVDVGPNDWCNLAYQFGHEFGHVFCNSWQPDAKPRNPCQWIEEALVEAFSLRGLGRLADSWATEPPFPHDGAYAGAIRDYRDGILTSYRAAASEQGMAGGFGAWFRAQAAHLAEHGGLHDARGAVATMHDAVMSDAGLVADMGALNRWPERSGAPTDAYLRLWAASCAELGSPGRLPKLLTALLAGA